MAKYSNTKAKINEKITTNSAQAITGNVLNEVLQTMVDSLGADYQFGGLVQPGSTFTAGEQPVVFLATTPGTYTNFGGIVVADGEVALLVWSGTAWSKQNPDIATRTEVSQLGQKQSFLDIDKISPLPAGTYHTPTSARSAVPSQFQKFGVVILYRTSISNLTVEQFVNDRNGYSLNDLTWKQLDIPFDGCINYSIEKLLVQNTIYDVDTGSPISLQYDYMCVDPIPVISGKTYYCSFPIVSVVYYNDKLNKRSASSLTSCYVSGGTIESNVFTVPAGCYFVSINFSKEYYLCKKYGYLIENDSFEKNLIDIEEPLSREGLCVLPYILENVVFTLDSHKLVSNNSYCSCFFPARPSTSYVIRCRYGQETRLQWVMWFSGYPSSSTYISHSLCTNESEIFNAPSNAKYIALSFTARTLSGFHDTYILEALDINPLICRRSGPCFSEYRIDNANDNSRVSVGMLGNTEANLSYNMDYRTGVHKAYDPTKGAIWLAMNGGGGAFQYAAANQPTTGDIWESDGYRYALWFSPYQFAVNTNKDDAKGSAAIWGKRRADQATFAGFDDCIIEGNRVKGTSGVVFINAYNNGKVIIANGGGRILLGGTTDDNYTRVQVSGAVKAEQFKLSNLNTAPSSSTDTGVKGEVRITEDYIYVCVDTNTWKRSALETW